MAVKVSTSPDYFLEVSGIIQRGRRPVPAVDFGLLGVHRTPEKFRRVDHVVARANYEGDPPGDRATTRDFRQLEPQDP
jgi:hypothetical protein